ncbi:MAG: phosphodiester glycosidase family protein [Parachlamydiaceae bacterium]|nr:phosphodiester glycosidase family protein [Parachlamydiaceae bacterium]
MTKYIISKKILFLLFFACISLDLNGISYEYFSNGYSTSVHVLTVNPNENIIVPVKSAGEEIGRETVMTLSKRYGAVAAVNGGFWKLNGNPAGILKINNHWHGTPTKPRGAIGWSINNPKVLIDRLLTNYQINDCLYPNCGEIEVIPMSIPPNTTPEEWREVEHIVGGTPLLVSKGCIIEDYSSEQTLESFLVKKHARTAVGIKNTGEWLFVVVDGRIHGLLAGMTMKELAELMVELGCIEALNLDGGGSSTMIIDNKVINEPCGKIQEFGKEVEAVSDAILIFPKKALKKI